MAHGGTCACAMRLPYQGMRRSLPLDFYQHLWRSKPVLAFQPVTSILISIYIGPSIKCNSRFTLPSPPPGSARFTSRITQQCGTNPGHPTQNGILPNTLLWRLGGPFCINIRLFPLQISLSPSTPPSHLPHYPPSVLGRRQNSLVLLRVLYLPLYFLALAHFYWLLALERSL